MLEDVPERIDDDRLSAIERIAATPLPQLQPCSPDHLLKCVRVLDTLPSRADDEVRGELRLGLMRRYFGHLPEAAWSFATEAAGIECDWFPTPKELQAIFNRWSRGDVPARAQGKAIFLARRERQARFDETRRALRDREVAEDQLDALPEEHARYALQERIAIETPAGLRYWTKALHDAELDRRTAHLRAG